MKVVFWGFFFTPIVKSIEFQKRQDKIRYDISTVGKFQFILR